MKTDTFSINLKEISCGDCQLELDFGSFTLPYNASYIGAEPLSTLIEAAHALQTDYEPIDDLDESEAVQKTRSYEIIWMDEPGYLRLSCSIPAGSSDLTIKIAQNFEDFYGVDDKKANEKQRETITMPQKLFFDAVINAALKALKKYGICGFHNNWNGNWDLGAETLPLQTLLQLLGADQNLKEVENENGLKSNIFEELELLQTALKQA